MPRALKPEHRLFIEYYLSNGYNMSQAYKSAYPNCTIETARVNGCRLMKTQRIKDEISARVNLIVGTPEQLREKVLLKLANMAFANKDDEFYPHAAQSKAIDMLNKLSGGYTEKIEITNKTIVVTLEDDDDVNSDNTD